jgi:hypothetical protein
MNRKNETNEQTEILMMQQTAFGEAQEYIAPRCV